MDPNATLQLLREQFANGDYFSAGITFAALDDWLKRGGFLPNDWRVPRPQI